MWNTLTREQGWPSFWEWGKQRERERERERVREKQAQLHIGNSQESHGGFHVILCRSQLVVVIVVVRTQFYEYV